MKFIILILLSLMSVAQTVMACTKGGESLKKVNPDLYKQLLSWKTSCDLSSEYIRQVSVSYGDYSDESLLRVFSEVFSIKNGNINGVSCIRESGKIASIDNNTQKINVMLDLTKSEESWARIGVGFQCSSISWVYDTEKNDWLAKENKDYADDSKTQQRYDVMYPGIADTTETFKIYDLNIIFSGKENSLPLYNEKSIATKTRQGLSVEECVAQAERVGKISFGSQNYAKVSRPFIGVINGAETQFNLTAKKITNTKMKKIYQEGWMFTKRGAVNVFDYSSEIAKERLDYELSLFRATAENCTVDVYQEREFFKDLVRNAIVKTTADMYKAQNEIKSLNKKTSAAKIENKEERILLLTTKISKLVKRLSELKELFDNTPWDINFYKSYEF